MEHLCVLNEFLNRQKCFILVKLVKSNQTKSEVNDFHFMWFSMENIMY